MNGRIVSAVIVAVLIAMCVAPVLADESDGETETRVSGAYVYKATAVLEANPHSISLLNIDMVFIDGSENDRMMDAYLADPGNMSISVIEDTGKRSGFNFTEAEVMRIVNDIGRNRFDTGIFRKCDQTGRLEQEKCPSLVCRVIRDCDCGTIRNVFN